MTLADVPICAFVASAQPERAKAFYSDVLGLRLLKDDGFALIYRAGGTILRVQKGAAGSLKPQRFTVLGWEVEDIEATVDALASRGVEFMKVDGLPQDARRIWDAGGGDRVCWFQDPDGNTLSLHEGSTINS